MKRSEAMRRYILDNGEQMIADTIYLAEHQSPTIRKEYVEKCADAITELIRKRLGLEPTAVFPQTERGRHLYYKIGEGRPKALILGHYDTVWNIDDLPLVRDGNKLCGPGVYDMKYGIVAGIWAIKALLATGGLDGCIGLFLNSDEEMGSRTSRAHFEPIAKEYPNALILEPAAPDGAVKVGRKSTGDFLIKIDGIAAHAGTDYAKGRSAILEAAYLTEQLFAMTDLDNGTSVNVGVISGGTKFNVIASHAEMKVDVRVTKKSEGDRLTRLISELKPRQDGVTLNITGGMNRPPYEFTQANQALFAKAAQAAAEFGIDLKHITVGGGSDGNFTSSWGIPTLDGLGPVGDGAHAEKEHLMIDASLQHTAILATLLSIL